MRISLIVAMTPQRVIGRDGALPWRLPADMRRFRRITMGHPVIMGRSTFQSIGAPLAGRANIVLTRQRDFARQGCLVAHSREEALELARRAAAAGSAPQAEFLPGGGGSPGRTEPVWARNAEHAVVDDVEVVVIGGAAIYALFLPVAERVYATIVHASISGDTFFPALPSGEWVEVERSEHPADERNPYACSFTILERRAGPVDIGRRPGVEPRTGPSGPGAT